MISGTYVSILSYACDHYQNHDQFRMLLLPTHLGTERLNVMMMLLLLLLLLRNVGTDAAGAAAAVGVT